MIRASVRAPAAFPPRAGTRQLVARGAILLTVVALVSAAVGGAFSRASADRSGSLYTGTAVLSQLRELRQSLDMAVGERELMSLELTRAKALLEFSSRFKIPADLAGVIYDAALREGLDPE
ncbi:MAG: hypothetical protein HY700_04130, partial [Gemmatimonadetes bacterium]|nr:hypothetical protein [Gemmatimonadota bacterium]